MNQQISVNLMDWTKTHRVNMKEKEKGFQETSVSVWCIYDKSGDDARAFGCCCCCCCCFSLIGFASND
jgi:hypothetical protein